MARTALPSIDDADIFIESNDYTAVIKGKRIRNRLAKEQVKVEIKPESQPDKEILVVTFHYPDTIDSHTLEEITDEVIAITGKAHTIEHHIGYEPVQVDG